MNQCRRGIVLRAGTSTTPAGPPPLRHSAHGGGRSIVRCSGGAGRERSQPRCRADRREGGGGVSRCPSSHAPLIVLAGLTALGLVPEGAEHSPSRSTATAWTSKKRLRQK